jgi:hypothetical protein
LNKPLNLAGRLGFTTRTNSRAITPAALCRWKIRNTGASSRTAASAALPEQSEAVLEKDGWIYFTATCPLGIAWFNGTCYTDLMNPEAVGRLYPFHPRKI